MATSEILCKSRPFLNKNAGWAPTQFINTASANQVL